MYRHTRDRYVNQCNAESHVSSTVLIIYVFSVTTDLYSISDYLIILFTVINCYTTIFDIKINTEYDKSICLFVLLLIGGAYVQNFVWDQSSKIKLSIL